MLLIASQCNNKLMNLPSPIFKIFTVFGLPTSFDNTPCDRTSFVLSIVPGHGAYQLHVLRWPSNHSLIISNKFAHDSEPPLQDYLSFQSEFSLFSEGNLPMLLILSVGFLCIFMLINSIKILLWQFEVKTYPILFDHPQILLCFFFLYAGHLWLV